MNFIKYNQQEVKVIETSFQKNIYSFVGADDANFDKKTVDSFSEEWLKFNSFTDQEIKVAGDQYFDIVNDKVLNKNSVVLDLGCGSGRWTKYISKKVAIVEAVDPSDAVFSALNLTKDEENVRVTQASVSNIPFDDNTFDFIVCLGVLHHIPDTQKALIDLSKKLKPNGNILLYLYYKLDNRGVIYKLIFNFSSLLRKGISKLPYALKKMVCDIIAILIYIPFVSMAKLFYLIFGSKKWIKKIPLSYYVGKSINIIRNDALDRFGTPLEQRFTKVEISEMLINAGITNNVFSKNEPYWHVLGQKI